MPELLTRLDRAEVQSEAFEVPVIPSTGWDWYAESCSCGLAPGSAACIPGRGPRNGRRRATGVSGLISPAAGPARRARARAGFNSGSTTAR